jgi:hypothetical protein
VATELVTAEAFLDAFDYAVGVLYEGEAAAPVALQQGAGNAAKDLSIRLAQTSGWVRDFLDWASSAFME